MTSDKSRSHFGIPGRFDPATGQWTPADLPEGAGAQFMALGPHGAIVASALEIDPETTKLITKFPYPEVQRLPDAPPGQHFGYEPAMDSKGQGEVYEPAPIMMGFAESSAGWARQTKTSW